MMLVLIVSLIRRIYCCIYVKFDRSVFDVIVVKFEVWNNYIFIVKKY